MSHQSFKSLEDLNNLTPLTKEIINRQTTINIGTIGHLPHDKTKLVRAISGIQTTRHKIEKERNIKYVLEYAKAKLHKWPKCPEPECYKPAGSENDEYKSRKRIKTNKISWTSWAPKCEKCKEILELIRHISFVDCPGHDILMAKM